MKKLIVLSMIAALAMAETITFKKYIPVYKSVEVHKEVIRKRPYEECWNEEVPVDEGVDEGTVGAVIGGAAGGILGHQIGKGSGKTAATIGGAVIGTLVGKNLAQSRAKPGYRVVRRCRTKYSRERDVVIEYKNYAKVEGRTIIKYSDRPLSSIPVKIIIKY
ncbi:glycine zipper 2TM domain-containing protein [Nitratiruptor sp. YY09-18]|uniref:glycine zipper 2TM domain-containing protein n=1 Tax=Nitratiruptor sp. YY09-18 TaxID=2724901 RepID=UPI001916AF3F|nr:glycine zipper 2TM domain-containing protein [Nitratiruptor sp. YY09-18]BCD67531.1 hypothetical protein NitYY0918_C0426 [Nitratiruptor sp. YY09-18]